MHYTTHLLRCPSCAEILPEHSTHLNEYGDRVCPVCACDELAHRGDRLARWVSVAAYTVERAYGGPEEGDLRYISETLVPESVRCFVFENWTEAQPDKEQGVADYKQLLKTRYGDGAHIAIHVRSECLPPKRLSGVRPTYC